MLWIFAVNKLLEVPSCLSWHLECFGYLLSMDILSFIIALNAHALKCPNCLSQQLQITMLSIDFCQDSQLMDDANIILTELTVSTFKPRVTIVLLWWMRGKREWQRTAAASICISSFTFILLHFHPYPLLKYTAASIYISSFTFILLHIHPYPFL